MSEKFGSNTTTFYNKYPVRDGYSTTIYFSTDTPKPKVKQVVREVNKNGKLEKRVSVEAEQFTDDPLNEEQKKFVRYFTGGVLGGPLLGAFLRQHCHIPEPKELEWKEIIAALIIFAERQEITLASDQAGEVTPKTEQKGGKAKGIGKPKNKPKSPPKKDFSFGRGQAFYKGNDLGLPTGAELSCVEILKKLVNSLGKVVKYKTLDENSADTASVFLRGKIRNIRSALKKHNVPYKIVTKKWTGYVLSKS